MINFLLGTVVGFLYGVGYAAKRQDPWAELRKTASSAFDRLRAKCAEPLRPMTQT